VSLHLLGVARYGGCADNYCAVISTGPVGNDSSTRRFFAAQPSGLLQIAPAGARWKMVVNLTDKQHADDDDDDNAAKDQDHALGPYLSGSAAMRFLHPSKSVMLPVIELDPLQSSTHFSKSSPRTVPGGCIRRGDLWWAPL
jgi:hypothetical protein